MKNKFSIVVTAVVLVSLVLWYLVQSGRVANPMWTSNVNRAYKDTIETYGSAMDVNIAPGGGAIWDKSRLKGVHLVEVMDKTMKTCCPIPTEGVVRVQMKIDIRHPYIATAIMSIYPELTYNQNRQTVEVRCANLGACLVLLAYVIGMATMPFDQFLTKYQITHTAPGSFASETKANLKTLSDAWNADNMGTYKEVKDKVQKLIEQYTTSLPVSLGDTTKCTAESCDQSVFDYPKFAQPPAPVRANEGFTTDRVFLEEGEYIENFMPRPSNTVNQRYVTHRHLDAPTPQLPAYSYTTLGGSQFKCGDGIVGCTLQNPMYRIAQTHEINSCAKPKTSYSIEPVSLKTPCDPFALGEKSYPMFDDATYHRLTHSMYSPNLPTRNAK